VIIALWYFTTGLRLPVKLTTTTTTIRPSHNTTINNTTSTTSLSTSVYYLSNCVNLGIFNSTSNSITTNYCLWKGGTLGAWVASGSSKSISYSIRGISDNVTYLKGTSDYSCITFLQNISLPAQIYNVTIHTGSPGGTCNDSYSIFKLNSTTTAPSGVVYTSVYNGNFSTGEYNGWNTTGTGFGSGPMSIAKANAEGCYQGAPWTGYNGSYFATTFNCGLSNSPGNLTSSMFIVNKPFLNFKIISPYSQNIYVEILKANVPVTIAHFNTYNISRFGNSSSYTFRNASIPLISLAGDNVRIRVVSLSLKHHNYIAVTGFKMSTLPQGTPGILYSLNTS